MSAKTLKKHLVPALLLVFLLVVGVWEFAAQKAHSPWKPFELTAADFADFRPQYPGYTVRVIPAEVQDPSAANVLSLLLSGADNVHMIVRLVHGYNMPMCLKIKHFSVEFLGRAESLMSNTSVSPIPDLAGVQLWRVTSDAGRVDLWLSDMLRAGDFASVPIDIRSMAFPRIGTPDDAGFVPRGLAWKSLKHPVDGLQRYFRSRWNASRMDVLTFLKLRQPAWASEDTFTLLVYTFQTPVRGREPELQSALLAVRNATLLQLQAWRQIRTAEDNPVD